MHRLVNLFENTTGVVQYDYGKLIQGQGFTINGVLNQPPEIVLAGLGKVRSAPIKSGMFLEYFSKYKPKDYADIIPDKMLKDRLFPKDCMHIEADNEAEDSWGFDFETSRNRRGDGGDDVDQRDQDEMDPNDPCKV